LVPTNTCGGYIRKKAHTAPLGKERDEGPINSCGNTQETPSTCGVKEFYSVVEGAMRARVVIYFLVGRALGGGKIISFSLSLLLPTQAVFFLDKCTAAAMRFF
jgi:hypothetical protein